MRDDADTAFDWLIVGAGFAGSVMAERIASQLGQRVLVIDRRQHIGGNAYDRVDAAGILVHEYGPHIFHTNSEAVFNYLSQFTRWRRYEHRVLASVNGMLVPMPINRTTVNRLFALSLTTDAEVDAFFARAADPVSPIRTAEDAVVSRVGRVLFDKLIAGYTRKQWGMEPRDLDASVTARVIARANDDDRYFLDRYQFMPLEGFTRMFERMLDHPLITLALGTEFKAARSAVRFRRLVFTGPIDERFDHEFGPLPYRSLRFRHETHQREAFQQAPVVNYPGGESYTRITEYKKLTGVAMPGVTSITYEFPSADGEPYYPVPREESRALFRRYAHLASARPDEVFVGRLANYQYFNMDQVVAQALRAFERIRAAALSPT
jgi:UDP-galactopyranose mutase